MSKLRRSKSTSSLPGVDGDDGREDHPSTPIDMGKDVACICYP